MKELLELLGPWPMLQGILLGILVATGAGWAARRGLQAGSTEPKDLEEIKAKWKVYEQLDHIHENSFALVKLQEQSNEIGRQIVAALNRLADARWNSQQP
jgi:hypothetical protein